MRGRAREGVSASIERGRHHPTDDDEVHSRMSVTLTGFSLIIPPSAPLKESTSITEIASASNASMTESSTPPHPAIISSALRNSGTPTSEFWKRTS